MSWLLIVKFLPKKSISIHIVYSAVCRYIVPVHHIKYIPGDDLGDLVLLNRKNGTPLIQGVVK